MKCELCHNAEAETAIRKEVAGELQELYVCRACAEQAVKEKTEASAPSGSVPQAAERDLGSALPLMGMILDAAFEIVGRAATRAEPACPVCGILRHEYRQRSRLGCPACYAAFSKELEAAIFELHRATRHVGKTPAKAKVMWERQQLETRLNEAVNAQRYEDAIALRDALRRMDAPKKGGPA